MNITFLGNAYKEIYNKGGQYLLDIIKYKIEHALSSEENPVLLTSLQTGVELWAGDIAQKNNIPYNVYLPFMNPHAKWPLEVRQHYSYLLRRANKVIHLDDGEYRYQKLVDKDITLINHSEKIYVFQFSPLSILKYAERQKKELIDLTPERINNEYVIH